MVNLVDILDNLITNINLEMQVKEIVGNQVFVCNTLHTTLGKIVTDSFGNQYVVTDMVINEWLELTPFDGAPDPFNDTIVNAPVIQFLHGTPQTANNEYLLLDQQTLNKTPFVWLLESYEYTQPELDSAIAAEFNVVLFVLDWCKEQEWTNDQHNNIVIKPMESLSNSIIDSINTSFDFRKLEGVTLKPRSRFGVEITNRGNRQKIFNDDLSGIEMRFTLLVRDIAECC